MSIQFGNDVDSVWPSVVRVLPKGIRKRRIMQHRVRHDWIGALIIRIVCISLLESKHSRAAREMIVHGVRLLVRCVHR